MKIDAQTVKRMAELSRLEFDAKGQEEMQADMNRMLDFIDKLNEVNVEGVEPLIFMTEEVNVLRDDHAESTITQHEALSNAPKKDMYYFRVPKVMGSR
ncbi:MAG: hypothetical protein RL220_922 [Bacteroidota bacterium]|jgi:aspartyl-tRNA(Asn)/glutamyl-tRNA(Gln) amidotransferase subunit C